MKNEPLLLPRPRKMTLSGGGVPAGKLVAKARSRIDPAAVRRPEGYRLELDADGAKITAHDRAGLFYALQTLDQVVRQASEETVPGLLIEDWPSCPVRSVMLDISRDRVPTMASLFDLADRLASWKVNQLMLYVEHTFAYRNHELVWAGASPMTAEQMRALDAYCRERFIELVPFQNCFGHMHRWLKHDRYRPLAECPGGFPSHWAAGADEPFSLCPADPAARALVTELIEELASTCSSSLFMVGCDETFDLGRGRSKAACESRGVGRVYLDYLQWLHRQTARLGKTMMYYGDIIIKYPDLIPELPEDAIAMHWGYGADFPFDDHCARFAAAGIPFYALPSTSTYSSVAGRTVRALGNIRNSAVNGLKHGARGLQVTIWGDLGTWQPPPTEYLPLAWSAAMSWAPEHQREDDLARALDLHVFQDDAGVMGRLAFDLGNVFLPTHGGDLASNLYHLLLRPHLPAGDPKSPLNTMTAQNLRETLDSIDTILQTLPTAAMRTNDAEWVREEFAFAADLLRLSARAGLAVCEAGVPLVASLPEAGRIPLAEDLERLMEEHRRLWLRRSRPGGLDDSLAWYRSLRSALAGKDSPA